MTRRNDLYAAKAFLAANVGGVPPVPVLAAVSGGLDSMCLLHLLTFWGCAHGLAPIAAHFNHRLRGAEADRDEAFVRDWCAEHEVPFVSGTGDVRALAGREGLSLEEAAREARYAFLTGEKERLGCVWILTAHHADDNAETMLLNLLRGTGLQGLSGIPAERDGILRPFLEVTREELAAYAAENGVPYVEDSTNREDDAARNVLRHQVLPVLKRLNPRAVENMSRAAALLRQDGEALDTAAEKLLEQAEYSPDGEAALPLDALRGQPEAVSGRAVRQLLSHVCGHQKDLTAAHIRAVLNLKRGQLSLPYGVTVYREGACLRFGRTPPMPAAQPISPGETVSFGSWRVRLAAEPETEGSAVSFPAGASLTITVWASHDRLNGRTVKRLCADRGMTAAERDALPVLRVDGCAAAAAALGIDENFAPGRHETGARVIFYKDRGERQ